MRTMRLLVDSVLRGQPIKAWCLAMMLSSVSLVAYAETTGTDPIEAMKEQILKILTTLRFDLAGQSKFCLSFFKDFNTQTSITHIKPIIETNDYNAPELEAYKRKCPKLELNKKVTYTPRTYEAIQNLPEEEREQYGDVYRGTRNFRLYRVDINNKPADGEELVFYHEKFLHVRHMGQEAEVVSGQAYDDRGEYLVIDFRKCRVLYGVGVDQWREGATVPAFHGVISYQQGQYIFDLYPLGGPDTYSLKLWAYKQREARLIPICKVKPVPAKQEKAP